jgi:hypothetical protein
MGDTMDSAGISSRGRTRASQIDFFSTLLGLSRNPERHFSSRLQDDQSWSCTDTR